MEFISGVFNRGFSVVSASFATRYTVRRGLFAPVNRLVPIPAARRHALFACFCLPLLLLVAGCCGQPDKTTPPPPCAQGMDTWIFLVIGLAAAVVFALLVWIGSGATPKSECTGQAESSLSLWHMAFLTGVTFLVALPAARTGCAIGGAIAVGTLHGWILVMLILLAMYRDLPEKRAKIWRQFPGLRSCLGISLLLIAGHVLAFAALWGSTWGGLPAGSFDAYYVSFENGLTFNPPEDPCCASKALILLQHAGSILLLIWALPVIGSRLSKYESSCEMAAKCPAPGSSPVSASGPGSGKSVQ